MYIEDVITHTQYNCPASRFYEGIQCNAALIFDSNCVNTIKKSGIWFDDDFYFDNYKNLSDEKINLFLKNNEEYAINTKEQTIKKFYNSLE